MHNIKDFLPSPIEKFITSQIGYSNKQLIKNKDYISKEWSLREFRTIIAGGIRQSGSTIACARLFDPSKDIYIGYKLGLVQEFNHKLIELEKVENKKEIKFKYFTMNKRYNYIDDKIQDKIIRKIFGNSDISNIARQEILNQVNSFSLEYPNSLRGHSIKSDAIFWFDLGNGLAIERMHEISALIKMLDNIQGDGTQKYIIL